MLVLVLVAVVGSWWRDGGDVPSPSSASGSAEHSASPARASAPVPPFSVVDEASLTVPDEFRAASGDVYLDAGGSYLASFEVSTVKPLDQPGLAMYLGVTFSCRGSDSGESTWIGGTENLLPGEPVTYRNQLLLHPATSEVMSCSVRANAPYDDVASDGATVELDISWSMRAVSPSAASAPSEHRLPMTIAPGQREFVFTEMIPLDHLPHHEVQLLTSLHVTTCTGVNGSREGGRTWCAAEDIDEAGSDFDVELRVDVLDEAGKRCGSAGEETAQVNLPLERHHQLVSRNVSFGIGGALCGAMLRAGVVVENRGPASLVVHESNSSMVTIGS